MRHPCNLGDKESGLEWACVNNDDFTVIISGGGSCHWVSMCTVWPLHSKWLSKYIKETASDFALSLSIALWKLFRWFRRLQLWATGDWQLHHNHAPTHASCLMQFVDKTSNHPGDSVPSQPRFGALQLLAFPKTKITFERAETSYSRWDLGTYDRAADGNWENCVRSQGAYFEGDWGVVVLIVVCILFLVSCILFNKCLCFFILYGWIPSGQSICHTHTYTHTHMYVYMCVCVYICVYMYVYAYVVCI